MLDLKIKQGKTTAHAEGGGRALGKTNLMRCVSEAKTMQSWALIF
jgi:hypothetical protein